MIYREWVERIQNRVFLNRSCGTLMLYMPLIQLTIYRRLHASRDSHFRILLRWCAASNRSINTDRSLTRPLISRWCVEEVSLGSLKRKACGHRKVNVLLQPFDYSYFILYPTGKLFSVLKTVYELCLRGSWRISTQERYVLYFGLLLLGGMNSRRRFPSCCKTRV